MGVGSKNQSTSNQQATQPPVPQPPSQYPPMMPPPPFIDPSLYYAQMALHMAQMAPVNPFFPMGPAPFGGMPPYPMSQHHHHRALPDDQQSIQSFHFDLDTRSEKKLNLMNNRPQSVAGGSGPTGLKTEPDKMSRPQQQQQQQPPTGLLIMEEAPSGNHGLLEPNVGLIESVMIKRVDENRMTPQLHQLPHVRASFSLNSLIKIRANDPCEGQPALVDILNLSDMMEHYLTNLKNLKINESDLNMHNELMADQEYDVNASDISEDTQNEILTNYRLLQEFPGPLVRETTAKAQVIQFCQKNVKECLSNSNVNLIDPQSHALLWDYLALLVRQNGFVDLKTDISPLLLTGIADVQSQWTSADSAPNPPQQSQSLTNASASNPSTKLNNNNNNLPFIKKSPSSSSLSALQQQQDFVLVNSEDQNENGSNRQLVKDQNSHIVKQNQPAVSQFSEDEAHMNKFRQLLGAGQKTNAIDLAIKYNMWSHALFLASSFNNTSISNTASIILASSSSSSSSNQANQLNEPKLLIKVKNRFINSLQHNDPIHTCYQLLAGRVPSVATVIFFKFILNTR